LLYTIKYFSFEQRPQPANPTMNQPAQSNLRLQTRLSIVMTLIGVALLIMMIAVESEPGALPLLIIVLGVAWFCVTRVRSRSHLR
jgi:hypothetical protein